MILEECCDDFSYKRRMVVLVTRMLVTVVETLMLYYNAISPDYFLRPDIRKWLGRSALV